MPVIETKDVVKHYGEHVAVNGVSLDVKEGDVFGLLGPNGAGKSTLINMICGLLRPTDGAIHVLGGDVHQNMRRIGYAPQTLSLYNEFTTYENLAFFGELYELRGEALRSGIERAMQFTGLTEARNKRAKTFSGGMLRRLNIACALVHEPAIMIMDEPTVGIDPQSRNHIMDAIREMNGRGVTVLYTSHYMEEIEALCNDIAIIDHGEIIARGSKQALKQLVTDQDTLEIAVDKPLPALLTRIEATPGVTRVKLDGFELAITSEKGANNLDAILRCLLEEGVRATRIDYKEVDLETVFLALTGRKLRD